MIDNIVLLRELNECLNAMRDLQRDSVIRDLSLTLIERAFKIGRADAFETIKRTITAELAKP